MKKIKELVPLVQPKNLKSIQVVGLKNDKADALYKGMLSKAINTQEQAIDQLFESVEEKYSKIYYWRVEQNLIERLINSILCIGPPDDVSKIRKAYFEVYKKLAVVQTLIAEGKRNTAIPIAEQSLKLAEEYEVSVVASKLASQLQLHYAIISPNTKLKDKYARIATKWAEIVQTEQKALNIYCNIAHPLSLKKEPQLELLEGVEEKIEGLLELAETYNTYRLWLLYYTVRLKKVQIELDWEGQIALCQEALEKWNTFSYELPYTAQFSFHYNQIAPYLQMGEYEKGKELVDKCLGLVGEGTYNWAITLQYQLTIGLHSENYEWAAEALDMVASNPKHLPESTREQWMVYEAWIEWLREIGKLPKADRRFQVGRFLNEVPRFEKDKRGLNISILILQLVFMLSRHEYGKYIDRLESLKQYDAAHLKDSYSYRSRQFMRMLMAAGHHRVSFHPAATARKVESPLKRLRSRSIRFQDQDVEVMNYELLWDLCFDIIQKNYKKK